MGNDSDLRDLVFGHTGLNTFLDFSDSKYQLKFSLAMPDHSVRFMYVDIDNIKQFMMALHMTESSDQWACMNLLMYMIQLALFL